ncbi:HET-domain-containing protein [Astrocystis sublimbata]|nr:HET-domain-containing protein [Astrocystis sublimbata]
MQFDDDKGRRPDRPTPINFLNTYQGFRQPTYEQQPKKYLGYCYTCLKIDGVLFHPDTKGRLLAPRRVPNTFDPEIARSWLSKCRSFHQPTCVPISIGFPESVIDCLTRTVAIGHPGIQYIALSYVWGLKANALEQACMLSSTGDPSHRLPDELPQTIEDAITITSMIGYRYIWIDMYCINQTDTADKQKQVAHMDVVYACADATIIVAAGDDCYSGIPGIGKTPRKFRILSVGRELRMSKWWTRAWTFQEGLLSHRRLVFTERQAFFECNAITSTEAIGGLELVKTRSQLQLYEDIFDSGVFKRFDYVWSPPETHSAIHLFRCLARIYSVKHLSFDSDALNAFSAIAMSFSRSRKYPVESKQGTVFNLEGLPFTLEQDSLEVSLTNSLLWSHGPIGQTRRCQCFPSWTWAEYDGAVDWELIGAKSDILYDVSELEKFCRKGDTIRGKEIHIRARVVKPDMWRTLQFGNGKWRGPPESPWGKFIFALPTSHGFRHASAYLLPYLMTGQWAALCAGRSRSKGTFMLYIIKMSAGGDLVRAGLMAIRYGWTSSTGDEAEHENIGLQNFLKQGTDERTVKLL